MCSIGEKLSQLEEKTRKKTGGSIDKKLPKLDEKMRRKTDYSLFVYLLRIKNLQNLAKKTGKKICC